MKTGWLPGFGNFCEGFLAEKQVFHLFGAPRGVDFRHFSSLLGVSNWFSGRFGLESSGSVVAGGGSPRLQFWRVFN